MSRRRGKRLALIAAVLLGACLSADPFVEELVEWRVAKAAGCAELRGLELDLGRWPLLVRALSGRLSDVRGDIAEVDVRRLQLRRVSVRVGRVRLSPAVLIGADVSLEDAVVDVHVDAQALTRFARAHGVPVDVGLGPQRLSFRPSLPLLDRVEVGAELRLESGAVVASVLRPTHGVLGRVLPSSLRITAPAGSRFTALEIDRQGVDATVRFAGRADVGDLCD